MSASRRHSSNGRNGGHQQLDTTWRRSSGKVLATWSSNPRSPVRARSLPGIAGSHQHGSSGKSLALAGVPSQRATCAGRSGRGEMLPCAKKSAGRQSDGTCRPSSATQTGSNLRLSCSSAPTIWASEACRSAPGSSAVRASSADASCTRPRGRRSVQLAAADAGSEDEEAPTSPYTRRLDVWRTAFEEEFPGASVGGSGYGFVGEIWRVAGRVGEVRKHFTDTRRGLAMVTQQKVDDGFLRQTERVEAQARDTLAMLVRTCGCLSELAAETQEISAEVEALTQCDQQMAELMRKCGKKLDAFTATLGSGL